MTSGCDMKNDIFNASVEVKELKHIFQMLRPMVNQLSQEAFEVLRCATTSFREYFREHFRSFSGIVGVFASFLKFSDPL